MANLEVPRRGKAGAAGPYVLGPGTLISAAIAVCLAQVALAIPAVLNGMFTTDLGPSSSQLTWITDAFLVPVCLLELTFGVLGDLFGRKRLLVGGALVLGGLVSRAHFGDDPDAGWRWAFVVVLVLALVSAVVTVAAARDSAALAAAVLALALVRGRVHETLLDPQTLTED